MGGNREGGFGNPSKPGPSQERRAGRLDALRDVLALPTTLKELTGEIRRLNKNLEDLNLEPTTIQEAIEAARDLRAMIGGVLGYRVKEPTVQLPRPLSSDRQ